MTLVEKMARTMYAAMADVIERAYAEQHEPSPDEYIPVVITALKAIRDHEIVFRDDEGVIHEIRGDPTAIWQAMIDQAIKGGGG